jgi:septal ring factor EnvC (AmiA/AmiB activator)
LQRGGQAHDRHLSLGKVGTLRRQQRAHLAERQVPVVRLTAALALVQPGSVDNVVHVRSLLASTLPIIRARTAALREEIARGNALREQAELAVAALVASQQDLRKQRLALAQLEARQRLRSESLASSAIIESDRALAFGEEARDLAELAGTREYQARLRRSLSELPGPMLRPGTEASQAASAPASPRYILPVEGRLVTGMGEISDAGVHARGLTFEVAPDVPVIAPRAGRVVYAGPFRGYGRVVIIDHGGGWTSVITNLASIEVDVGDAVAMGRRIGRTGPSQSRVTVELRRGGRPYPIAPLIASG